MTQNGILSYRRLLDDAKKTLYDSSETPRIDAEVLMQHVIDKPLAWLVAHGDTAATPVHTQAFCVLMNQRNAGHPIAYLIGKKDFWNLSLKVDNRVLIPRADTETLVEQALERLASDSPIDVLDLGTGSGAIALSIAKERPMAKVRAIDSQNGALTIARENAYTNNIDNVIFLQSNWYSALPSDTLFDLIASNPPYVESDDPHLARGDLRFEPNIALVAENRGLSDLKIIIQNAPRYLKAKGWLIVEHGYNQAEDVAAFFKDNAFNNVECFEDINKLPRCTAGRRA